MTDFYQMFSSDSVRWLMSMCFHGIFSELQNTLFKAYSSLQECAESTGDKIYEHLGVKARDHEWRANEGGQPQSPLLGTTQVKTELKVDHRPPRYSFRTCTFCRLVSSFWWDLVLD